MSKLSRFSRNEAGNVMMMFVISLVAIVAMVGGTLALSMDSKSANTIQHTADSAALGGATAFLQSNSAKLETRIQEAETQAKAFATHNSRYHLNDFSVVSSSEDAYGQSLELVVEVGFDPANAAASITGRNANVDIARRAKAEAVWGFPLCVLALSESDEGLILNGTAELQADNCIVWSNSKNMRSFNFLSGKTQAKSYCAAGGVFGGTRATPRPEANCDPIPDPLEALTTPAPGSCQDPGPYVVQELSDQLKFIMKLAVGGLAYTGDFSADNQDALRASAIAWTDQTVARGSRLVDQNGTFTFGEAEGLTLEELLQIAGYLDNIDPLIYTGDGYSEAVTHTFKPGTYCGLDISHGHVRFEPGTYVMKDGPLIVRKRATLTAEGVSIVLHGEKATFNVLDEARLEIAAPVTGDMPGMAVIEDRTASTGASSPLRSRLTGSGSISIIGTMYMPRQVFSITGAGAGAQTSPLLQIVAHSNDIVDQGQLLISFDETKTKVPAGIKPERTARLLE